MQIFFGLMRVPTTDSLRPLQTTGSSASDSLVAAGGVAASKNDRAAEITRRLHTYIGCYAHIIFGIFGEAIPHAGLDSASPLPKPLAMTNVLNPHDCTTMAEVRVGVDDVDSQIVALLKRRFGYMDAAARIKSSREAVRDEWRKADVLAKVDAAAAELGVDRILVARIYEDLIETSIAHEFVEYDRRRA